MISFLNSLISFLATSARSESGCQGVKKTGYKLTDFVPHPPARSRPLLIILSSRGQLGRIVEAGMNYLSPAVTTQDT
jgi:hypothetical protein